MNSSSLLNSHCFLTYSLSVDRASKPRQSHLQSAGAELRAYPSVFMSVFLLRVLLPFLLQYEAVHGRALIMCS